MNANSRASTRLIDWSALNAAEQNQALARPPLDRGELESRVAKIIATVRERGDAALRDYAEQFDGVVLEDLRVSEAELRGASSRISPALMTAIEQAAGRIRAFHEAGAPRGFSLATEAGLDCSARYLPISPVGLYVPGGSAPLISTVMMLAIPAAIAGCGEVVLCTPPGPGGRIDPAVLAAAWHCGVTQVLRSGGAQAIGAMAFGTESIPACAKLFGPGNAWVTEAKRQVSALPGGPAQDMPAGPSEVLVIADADADPDTVGWDLLSQAEHGPDSQAVLLSDSRTLLEATAASLPRLAAKTERAAILDNALHNLRLIKVADLAEAITVSNRYAPEHLIINTANADELLEQVTTAGSVFLGRWTPESLGRLQLGNEPRAAHLRARPGLQRPFRYRLHAPHDSAARHAGGPRGCRGGCDADRTGRGPRRTPHGGGLAPGAD